MADERTVKTQSFSLYPRVPSSAHPASLIVARKSLASKSGRPPIAIVAARSHTTKQHTAKEAARSNVVDGLTFPPTPPSSVSDRSSVEDEKSPVGRKSLESWHDSTLNTSTPLSANQNDFFDATKACQQQLRHDRQLRTNISPSGLRSPTPSTGRPVRDRRTGLRKPGTGLKWKRIIHLGDSSPQSSKSRTDSPKGSTEMQQSTTLSPPKHDQCLQHSCWTGDSSTQLCFTDLEKVIDMRLQSPIAQPPNAVLRDRERHDSIETSEETSYFDDDDDDDDHGTNLFTQCFKMQSWPRDSGRPGDKSTRRQRPAKKGIAVAKVSEGGSRVASFSARLRKMVGGGRLAAVARGDGG